MSTSHLFAPWRMQYIRSLGKPDDGRCFLCDAADASNDDERRSRLVLWQSEHCVVGINCFPYTNGHLLVSPRVHKADFDELSPGELLDLQTQTARAIRLLKRAISPQGFNVGINLGRCAGAGVPGHMHQHVVPRWNGDTNFMGVIGEVRVVPEAMSILYDDLIQRVPTLE